MLPLKDNLPTERLPLVTLLLIAAGLLAAVLRHHGELLELLLDALFLWMFGPSVEDSTSRPRFLAFCALGAAVAIGVRRGLDPDAASWTAGAAGAVAATIAGHVRLYPRARVVSMLLVPFLFRLLEVPTWILLALWLASQALLGGWVGFAAQAAAFAFGLLTIGAVAQRRKRQPPPRSAQLAGTTS